MYKNYNMNQVVLSFDFTVELEKKDRVCEEKSGV